MIQGYHKLANQAEQVNRALEKKDIRQMALGRQESPADPPPSRPNSEDSGRNIEIPRIPAGIGMAEGPAKSPNSVGYIPAEYGAERPEWGIRWDSAAEYEGYIIRLRNVPTARGLLIPPRPAGRDLSPPRRPRAHDSLAPRRPRHVTLPATSNVAGPATTTPTPPYPVANATSRALEDEQRVRHVAAGYGVGGIGPEVPVSTPNPIRTSRTPVDTPASTSDTSAAVSNQRQPRKRPRRSQLDPSALISNQQRPRHPPLPPDSTSCRPRNHFEPTAASLAPTTRALGFPRRPSASTSAHRAPVRIRFANGTRCPSARRRVFEPNPTINTRDATYHPHINAYHHCVARATSNKRQPRLHVPTAR
ncbi:hypothetical protein GALMADRAFT_149242 [Galerina marginata CBS 339.88]|uniref:Uncharacterized protein n=1 Tax=Galerina marginata (strain CBS 339.88) TaxID=685588 RepID=A0A067S4Q2_GALM3|nr:hypothetical protein GALMADRAFT_149242 [Galerina marginata CBS 339.88]